MLNNNVSKKKKKSWNETLFILCCISIPIIHWLIFYVYANASSFLMAFTDSQGNLSFANFTRFYKEMTSPNTTLRLAFRNTFLTFGIQLAAFPFKVLVSYFIYKKVPGYGIYRVLFFLPSILFSVCTAMMFTRVIGVNGFIAQGVGEWLDLGMTPELLADSRFANTVVLLEMLWLGFPGDLIIWGGTFARIPEELLEAGIMDGTNWWTEFTKIIVPVVWPTVGLQMVLLFCGVFGASGSVFLLTGGDYGTMTISAWQYITLLESSGSRYTSNVYNYLSAVGLIMTVIAITLSLVIRKYADKIFDEVEF